MSSGRAWAAFAVSLALLTGCGPQKKPVAVVSPPAPEVPQLPPSQMAAALPLVPPAFPVITTHLVKLDTTAPPAAKPEVAATQPHRPPKRRSSKPTADEAKGPSSSLPSTTQTAQVGSSQPEPTRLGPLTTAPDPVNTADRQAVSGKIDATENGLNGIKRPLSSDEQKTATLIRQYITRARDALKADDLDGANTLSAKANQLLQELTKP
jgi:hypothetical protein